jgi:hypothetical protein
VRFFASLRMTAFEYLLAKLTNRFI